MTTTPFCSVAGTEAGHFAGLAVGSVPCWATLSRMSKTHTHTHNLTCSTIQTLSPSLCRNQTLCVGVGGGIDGSLGSVSLMQQVSSTVLGAKTHMCTLRATDTHQQPDWQTAPLCFQFHSIYSILIWKWFSVTMTTKWCKANPVCLEISVVSAELPTYRRLAGRPAPAPCTEGAGWIPAPSRPRRSPRGIGPSTRRSAPPTPDPAPATLPPATETQGDRYVEQNPPWSEKERDYSAQVMPRAVLSVWT